MVFLGNLFNVQGTKSQVGLIHNFPEQLPQDILATGVMVNALPDPQPPTGQVVSATYVDTASKEVTYDYMAPPKTQEQQLADMQVAVLNLQTAVAAALGV